MSNKPPFSIRGYYTIFSRNQCWGLDQWKRFVDCMVEDGCNSLILWMGGGVPSKRYPETWEYNKDHPNMRENFAAAVVDYARSAGIETLIGFTPYAYDGVASYANAHRELAGVKEDGSVRLGPGIHDYGMWLCPQHERSREFMLDYARELYHDFLPNADGLFLESSDYGHCMCEKCRENYLELEWEFVQAISEDVWSVKPGSRVVIYPYYFQRKLAPADKRYTLFFTGHSTQITPDMLASDCDRIYWDGLYCKCLDAAKSSAVLAADNGMQGYNVAMECFGYTRKIGGKTIKLTPFDVPWVDPGTLEFDDLTMQVMRFGFKAYCTDPQLSDAGFERAVAERFFGSETAVAEARDLLYLFWAVQSDPHSFLRKGALIHPEDIDILLPDDKLEPGLRVMGEKARRLNKIAQRYQSASGTAAEMSRIARWVVDNWEAKRPKKPTVARR